MTYLELCQLVYEEIDTRVGTTLTTTDLTSLTDPFQRRVVRAVARAYLEIQQSQSQWEFLRNKGKFLDVIAEKDSYTKAGVEKINYTGMYFVPENSTARYPMCAGCYDSYKYLQSTSPYLPLGVPYELIDGPFDDYILYHTPNTNGAVYAEWWDEPTPFETDDDEPIWAENFHTLVAWKAIREIGVTDVEDQSGKELQERAQRYLLETFHRFHAKYLPSFRT